MAFPDVDVCFCHGRYYLFDALYILSHEAWDQFMTSLLNEEKTALISFPFPKKN